MPNFFFKVLITGAESGVNLKYQTQAMNVLLYKIALQKMLVQPSSCCVTKYVTANNVGAIIIAQMVFIENGCILNFFHKKASRIIL